jgi:hypothetical protein
MAIAVLIFLGLLRRYKNEIDERGRVLEKKIMEMINSEINYGISVKITILKENFEREINLVVGKLREINDKIDYLYEHVDRINDLVKEIPHKNKGKGPS